jgi:hypothetical protein
MMAVVVTMYRGVCVASIERPAVEVSVRAIAATSKPFVIVVPSLRNLRYHA